MSSRQFTILLALSVAILGIVIYMAFRPCQPIQSGGGNVGINGTGKIVVFVKNANDGTYRSGIKVELQSYATVPLPPKMTDTTDSSGHVTFNYVPDGFYIVNAESVYLPGLVVLQNNNYHVIPINSYKKK